MKKLLKEWKRYITEADEVYFQDTFNVFVVLSLSKDLGGTREQVKNDIRAIPEVLTIVPVEPPEGIQRDVGTRIITTQKVHLRQPTAEVTERTVAFEVVKKIGRLRGVKVVEYDLPPPSPLEETEEYPGTLPQYVKGHERKKKRLIGKGAQPNSAPYSEKPSYKRAKSAPPGFGGAAEE
jgi:hypothetical protein